MIDVKYARCMISWCYHIHMAGVLQKRENSDVGNACFFFFFFNYYSIGNLVHVQLLQTSTKGLDQKSLENYCNF